MEIKALVFTLIRGSSGAEGVFLNQNLPIRSASVLRDFNAYFLGTLTQLLFDFVHSRLRVRLPIWRLVTRLLGLGRYPAVLPHGPTSRA